MSSHIDPAELENQRGKVAGFYDRQQQNMLDRAAKAGILEAVDLAEKFIEWAKSLGIRKNSDQGWLIVEEEDTSTDGYGNEYTFTNRVYVHEGIGRDKLRLFNGFFTLACCRDFWSSTHSDPRRLHAEDIRAAARERAQRYGIAVPSWAAKEPPA